MATTIPGNIPDEAPRSERIVAEQLRDAPRDWVALHSVHVPQRDSPRPREIDFVVLIPEHCVILCLEIKGGSFEVRDGQWYRPHTNEETDSPIAQAETAMFALKDYLRREYADHTSGVVDTALFTYGCAVVLTDAEMPDGIRKPKWPVYSHPVIQSGGELGSELAKYARRLPRKRIRRELQNEMVRQVARWNLDRLRRFLVPDFSTQYASATRPTLEAINAELLRLTEDQYEVLRLTERNPRCVIEGAAGTGKSLLALELARRRHDAGDRVAVVCQNYNLGDWFRRQVPPDLPAGNTGQVFADIFGDDPGRLERLRRHSSELQEAAIVDALSHPPGNQLGHLREFLEFLIGEYAEMDEAPHLDYLIVDEAQLMCIEPILKVMNVVLRGGLAEGHWTMFGDFANQHRGDLLGSRSRRDDLRRFRAYWAEGELWTNCRNTQPIAAATARAAGIDGPEPSAVHGPPVKVLYWRERDEVADLIDKEVSCLRLEGVRHHQVFLLSTAALGPFEGLGFGGMLDIESSYGGWKLFPKGYSQETSILEKASRLAPSSALLNYSDVVMFQGLESDVVLLIAVPEDHDPLRPIEADNIRQALYVGMSRARGALILLAHEAYREILQRALCAGGTGSKSESDRATLEPT